MKKFEVGNWLADGNGIYEVVDVTDVIKIKEVIFNDDGSNGYGETFSVTFADLRNAVVCG